jgi:N-acetylmuramoyl-L-alanine amidase
MRKRLISGIGLSVCLLVTAAFASSVRVIDRTSGATVGTVTTVQVGRYQYCSVASLARTLDIPYSVDKRLKQITLSIKDQDITLTAISPFVLFPRSVYQLPVNVLFRNGTFYAPLLFLTQALSFQLEYPLDYNQRYRELIVEMGGATVTAAQIFQVENGILIRISTRNPVKKSNLFLSESNNWLYLDLYGEQVDTLGSFRTQGVGKAVKKVVPIQLSEETARLSFYLPAAIKSRELTVQESPSQVVISLKTREDLSDRLLEELEREREKWKIDVIIIDPGHGGKDPGAIGHSGHYEKDIVLDIAKALKKELQRRLDVQVLLTRDGDRFLPLKKRTQFANQHGGKLLISIHADANPVRSLRGHTVYFLGPAKTKEARQVAQFENSVIKYEEGREEYEDLSGAAFILGANAQNAYHKESQDLAALLSTTIQRQCNSHNHGVRQAGFYVLYGAGMPNVLIESGFISNPYDEHRLNSKSYQKRLAGAICDGIVAFKTQYEYQRSD